MQSEVVHEESSNIAWPLRCWDLQLDWVHWQLLKRRQTVLITNGIATKNYSNCFDFLIGESCWSWSCWRAFLEQRLVLLVQEVDESGPKHLPAVVGAQHHVHHSGCPCSSWEGVKLAWSLCHGDTSSWAPTNLLGFGRKSYYFHGQD